MRATPGPSRLRTPFSLLLPLAAAGLLWAACASPAVSAQSRPREAAPRPGSSLLIRGGDVLDGTGAPARRVDVRIAGDSIAEVRPGVAPRAGERVIDASGLTVAPGFIDLHSHADRGLSAMPGAESQLRQGITTAVVGQDGSSELPISDFYAMVERVRPAINFTTAVGHGTVRRVVMGGDFRRAATPDEIRVMQALVDRAMKDGAVGLSSGLEYDPGFYATVDELAALASAVAPHGGYYASHVRDEENRAFEAWREAIEVGRRAGVPAHISHIKLASLPVWGRAAEGLRMLDSAARTGGRVTADWYPYTYWQSSIYVLIPERDFENREMWRVGLEEVGGAQNVLITGGYTPDTSYHGLTLQEIADRRGQDPVTTVIEMVRAAGPGIRIIGTSMDESDLAAFAAHPRVLISSDGGLSGPHPRGYGAFPRVLARYVRETRALALPEAIAKMSGRSARLAGLDDRGTIAVGKKADLVIFDPATIQDRGTKTAPAQEPVGVRYVIVNGELALEGGRPTGARAGRALRHRAP